MPEKIEELARTLLKNPVEVKIAVSKPAEKIKQSAYVCYEEQKIGIIKDIFKQGGLKRVIIFSGKKQKVKLINRALAKLNINSGEMHSDLEQAQRDDIMYKFKSGQIDVLVATDIVARGIDIDDIAMVINFDVPRDAEDYVHRIGRTARADRDGAAITFISDKDIYYFKQIEKLLEKEVEKIQLPDELGKTPEYKIRERGGRDNGRAGRRNNEHKRRNDNEEHKESNRRNRRNKRHDNTSQPQEADAKSTGQPETNGDKGTSTDNATTQEHKTRNNRERRNKRKPRQTDNEGIQKATEAKESHQPASGKPNDSRAEGNDSRRRQKTPPVKAEQVPRAAKPQSKGQRT